MLSVIASYERIFEGHDNVEDAKDRLHERRNGLGQRLQRQANAWEGELKGWIKYDKNRSTQDVDRVTLGCTILIHYCALLHEQMTQCNTETVDREAVVGRSRAVQSQRGEHSSLLLSVTDPKLPKQPGSQVRYWFPEDRQLKQPQSNQTVLDFLTREQKSQASPLRKSEDLDQLLTRNSFDDLKKLCTDMDIIPLKLNRLRMAESILFSRCAADSSSKSRSQPPSQVHVS